MSTGNRDEKRRPDRAAALKYDPGVTPVPVIVGLGRELVAEKIIETAEEYGIPIVEDSGLAEMLGRLSVGDEIPPELYEVVAQILVYVSDMDRRYGERMKSVL